MSMVYSNYNDLALSIEKDTRSLFLYHSRIGMFAKDITVSFRKADGTVTELSRVPDITYDRKLQHGGDYSDIKLHLSGDVSLPDDVTVRTAVYCDRIELTVLGLPGDITPVFEGRFCLGKTKDCLAVCLDCDDSLHDLRSSLGPTVSPADDAVFDRSRDCSVSVDGNSRRLGYLWEDECYTFRTEGKLTVRLHENVIADKFHVIYSPINKNCTFPKPPAGWMTWYAVKFDACEKAVLENTEKQKEYFAEYGADSIWVDWEWYHSVLGGSPVSDDIGYMSPDPVRYPNGLKYVSDEIRKQGFTPCLWVGPTHEPDESTLVKKYKDCIGYVGPQWCGRYFFDITNDRVRDELIPEAFEKVKEWGYDALKWDCIPITLGLADEYHENKQHPELTSNDAMRILFKKARETVGEDFYMLACHGVPRLVNMSLETFDACRIGGDIFTWEEYIKDFVDTILTYYPYHNTAMYCDPDNVVIREEFNSLDQARARVTMVALLGLPTTLGDDLRELSMERVDLIRRALPTIDACPKDIRAGVHDGKRFLVNLAVSRPFETWNVAAVLNLLENEETTVVDLEKDLKLEKGEYLVYDYWNDRFLGCFSEDITLTQPATSVSLLSVRRKQDRPQVLSTSRHVTQGAVDLIDTRWDDASRTLTVEAKVVKDDPYKISIYVPEGYTPTEGTVEGNVLTKTLIPDATSEIRLTFKFN